MTAAARASRPAPQPPASPDLSLVDTAPEKPAPETKKPAPEQKSAVRKTASAPPATTEDPWRNLHPSRVWPD